MLSEYIQNIAKEILKNEPTYTNLICNISTVEDGVYLLNVIRKNRYLIECTIELNEESLDIKILRLIKKAITFKIEENKFKNDFIMSKFQFFKKMEDIRVEFFKPPTNNPWLLDITIKKIEILVKYFLNKNKIKNPYLF